jgi:hypothetical protein
MHFTHVEHLETVIRDGLLCDADACGTGVLAREAGHRSIKAGRRQRPIPIHPFGVVADYVPFYFAARSPMMSAISHGNVPEFGTDVTKLVYLVTTTQAVLTTGLTAIATDRNAALAVAEFRLLADCGSLVDWDIMIARYWRNTDEDPERRERRMAECLVHRRVPFDVLHGIAVHNDQQATAVGEVLDRYNKSTPVVVRPGWYI